MRKHRGNIALVVIMLILMAIGLVVMYTIGPVRVNFLNSIYGKNDPESAFFRKHLISLIISLGVFLAFSFTSYEKIIRKFAGWFLAFSLFLCLILAFSQVFGGGLAVCENGACRWIKITSSVSIQPADVLKMALSIYLPILAVRGRKMKEEKIAKSFREFQKTREKKKFLKKLVRNPWVQFLVIFVLSLFFVVVMQKDLGSGIPIVVISGVVLLLAGVSKKVLAFAILIMAFLLGCSILLSPHRRERLFTYLGMSIVSKEQAESGSTEDADNAYHIENALLAIGTGGLFGVGIGNSVQATGYLPESINDSIFAIIGEIFGFVGLSVLVLLFGGLLLQMLKVSERLVDLESHLVVSAIYAWIFSHVVINIMAMIKLMPLTGITLPLLSYGGTSLMCVSGALGLVFQLSKYTVRKKVPEKERFMAISRELAESGKIGRAGVFLQGTRSENAGERERGRF